MHCPFCNELETKVIDSRLVSDGTQVRRRRECLSTHCNERFTTFEVAELTMPNIIKRDGRRKPFDEQKLRVGMLRALEKRPVGAEQFESVIQKLKHQLRASGEREISSQTLGKWAMEELWQLDEVAYVRFASVYLNFQDVSQFKEAVKHLKNNGSPKNQR